MTPPHPHITLPSHTSSLVTPLPPLIYYMVSPFTKGYNNRGYGQKPDWSVDPASFGRPIPQQPQQSYPPWQYEGRQYQYQQQFGNRPYQDRDGNSYQPYDMRGRGFEASDNYRGRDVRGREPERADPRFADGFQRREAWAQRSGDYPQMNQGREERGTPSMSREYVGRRGGSCEKGAFYVCYGKRGCVKREHFMCVVVHVLCMYHRGGFLTHSFHCECVYTFLKHTK